MFCFVLMQILGSGAPPFIFPSAPQSLTEEGCGLQTRNLHLKQTSQAVWLQVVPSYKVEASPLWCSVNGHGYIYGHFFILHFNHTFHTQPTKPSINKCNVAT